MPQPRKTMPKRLGKAEGGGTSAKACSDSSQGRATVQPAPRRTARREMGKANFLVNRDMKMIPQRLEPHFFFTAPSPAGTTANSGSAVQPSLTGLFSLLVITQDYVLGYFQTSLRD